jgi:hypothetical protein
MHEFQTTKGEQIISWQENPTENGTATEERARHVVELWEKRAYTECLQTLEELPYSNSPEVIHSIGAILTPKLKRQWFFQRGSSKKKDIAKKLLKYILQARTEEADRVLAAALFHQDQEVALCAEDTLAQRGRDMIGTLIAYLNQRKPLPYWHFTGMIRAFTLLQKYGDRRAIDLLIRALEKPKSLIPNDNLGRSAINLSYIVNGGIAFYATHSLFIDDGGGQGLFVYIVMFFVWGIIFSLLQGIFVIATLLLLTPFRILGEERAKDRLTSTVLKALLVIPDKRVLPNLIRFARSRYTLQREIEAALRPLLRLVAPEDEGLLSPMEEAFLAGALDDPDTDFTLAILHVLECIGTEGSLYLLSRVIGKSENPTIVERATHAYNAIEERVSRQEEKKNLLRASEMPEHTHELLRPAQDAPEQEAQKRELLRPTEGHED